MQEAPAATSALVSDQPREPVYISPCPHTLNDDYNFTKTTLYWHLFSIRSCLFQCVVCTLQILSLTWSDTIYPRVPAVQGKLFHKGKVVSLQALWVLFKYIFIMSLIYISLFYLYCNCTYHETCDKWHDSPEHALLRGNHCFVSLPSFPHADADFFIEKNNRYFNILCAFRNIFEKYSLWEVFLIAYFHKCLSGVFPQHIYN